MLEEYENAYRKLWFDSAVEVDDSLWFAANNLNGIFRSDKKTGKSQFITNFPQYPNHAIRLYTACTIVKRKIVFAPCNAKEIAIFDIEKKELKTFQLEKRIVKHCKSALFFAAFEYKGFAYLIGMSYPGILKIDVMTYDFDIIKEPFTRYYCNGKYDYKAHFRHSFAIKNNILYLPAICENGLVCMNMDSCKCNFLEVLPNNSKAWDVCVVNDSILTWGKDFKLSHYDLKTENIRIIDIENDGKFLEEGAYLISHGTNIWIFRLDSKGVINYDIETGKVTEEIKNINNFSPGMNQSYARFLSDIIILSKSYWDNEFWIFNSIINEFIRINDFGKIDRKCFWADGEWDIFDYIWNGTQKENMVTIESANMDLLNFIALIKNKNKNKKDRDEHIYGEIIYKKVLSLL